MPIERIPLTQPVGSRNGTFATDGYSANCFFETRGESPEAVKRPGLVAVKQITPVTPPAYLQAQGITDFNNKLVTVINNTVYQINPASSYATTTLGTTSSASNQCYFAKSLLDTSLFFHNKTNGYSVNQSGTLSALDNTKVSSVEVVVAGASYSTGTTITFSAPGSGTTATGTVNWSTSIGGAFSSISMTNGGTGYTGAPTVTINQPATKTPTGTGTYNTYTVTVSSATGLYSGMYVTGTGIGTNAQVQAVNGTTITLTVLNAGAVSGTLTFSDNGSGAVLVASLSNFPSGPFVCGAVYIDGYVFVGDTSNKIWNSNLGDPTTWDPLGYISFEQTSDNLVAISKHLNYLVAFGSKSIQMYYDAGNAVGSPLNIADSYTSEYGCANGDSVVSTSNTVIWVGNSQALGRSVYLMDGVIPHRVSTDNIDRHLQASNMSQVTAYCYNYSGHLFYILTLHDLNQTLVYDLTTKEWYSWTQYAMMSTGQPNAGTYQESYFRPTFYAQLNGSSYVLDDDTATLYQFSSSTYQDNGQPIYYRVVTKIEDNGTTKRKFYGRLEIVGDKTNGTMLVSHTGNDYNTWSTARSVNLNATRSQIYSCGADRRRAWQFLCTDNVPIRLQAAEIEFDIGEMDQAQNVGASMNRRR
jgi:hypothetical protein